MNPSPVLVTDAPSNASLAVVRSLGRRGIPVGVCTFADEFNLAGFSRWTMECAALPSPSLDATGFIDGLGRVLQSGKYPIVFPTTERMRKKRARATSPTGQSARRRATAPRLATAPSMNVSATSLPVKKGLRGCAGKAATITW